MALEARQVAQAYVGFIADDDPALVDLISDDCYDNVSERKGKDVWEVVARWLDESFAERRVELDGYGTLDDGRIAVWVTVFANHVGSGFPWLGDRHGSGRRVAWKQLHVFRTDGELIVEHWAVRDDLRVLQTIDAPADE